MDFSSNLFHQYVPLHRASRLDVIIFAHLSFSVRILGGILLIAAQLTRPVNTGLYTGAYVLESAGLSPLLLATLGFLRTM